MEDRHPSSFLVEDYDRAIHLETELTIASTANLSDTVFSLLQEYSEMNTDNT